MDKNWFRPYGSEKECWLAAMGDVYDRKPVDKYIETLVGSSWEKRLEPMVIAGQKIRPISKHRALIDLYWKYPGSNWQGVQDILYIGEQPHWKESVVYHPYEQGQPKLYTEYLKLVESGVVTV